MAFMRRMVTAGATLLLGYAFKKLMARVEAQVQAQGEVLKQQAEEQRDVKEFKKLKQDPATGEYYAEE
jgi:enoyl-[acyl-carrier-protein] reductase (NADH)